MPLWKNKAYKLTEGEIRYAMENSLSNAGAARFLKISYPTFKKYAKMYVDESTGKTLFEIHRNKGAVGISRSGRRSNKRKVADILAGKHPEYSPKMLKRRLITEGFRAEECSECGFSERRITDYTVPLILVWLDGDKTNHKDENLKLMCYNCFYLTQSDLFNRRADKTDFKGY